MSAHTFQATEGILNGDSTYKLHASGFCPCPLQPVDLSVNKILYVQTDGLKLFLKEKH